MVINKTFFQSFFSPLLEDFAYKPGTFSPTRSDTLSMIYSSNFLGARCEYIHMIRSASVLAPITIRNLELSLILVTVN